MKLVKLTFLITYFSLIGLSHLQAQSKFEKEYRVKIDEVPSKAITFINWQKTYGKLKWYYEESHEANTYEGKLKIDNRRYSIEFDTLGNLLDIEIELDLKKVESPVLEEIKQSLSEKFDRHKIIRLQQQFSGEISSLNTFLSTSAPTDTFTVRYEMTIKGKRNGNRELYEVTFNAAGKVLKIQTIVSRNTDNLEY